MPNKYTMPRGTRDFLPQDTKKMQYLEFMLKQISELFGYQEIRTPVFEHTEVFLRSVGESSDIVNKEMYTFKDRGDRSITLRPEGTAGVVRAFVESKTYATADLPVKYYYCEPVFRYERPQAGRYRQLHQFGIEALGIKSAYLDAELILLINQCLNQLGINRFTIKINTIGDSTSRENYRNALKEYFAPYMAQLCEDCQVRYEKNPLRILDCKVDGEKEIIKNAPKISNYISKESKEYFDKLCSILDGFRINYVVDESLVRGLDYYSDTVFEIQAVGKDGKDYGAIGGGGRYDNLIEEFDGPKLPAAGFAFGMERLMLIMDEFNLFDGLDNSILAYVMPMDENSFGYSYDILIYLRANGFKADIDYLNRSIKSRFKTVDRKNARFAILVGNDELTAQTVTIKNNTTKEQITIPVMNLVEYFDEAIATEQQSHSDECSCGCGEHEHDGECGCGCGEHEHDGECGCGCGEHEHDGECSCGCGEHEHDGECGCGCGEHEHDGECGCGCGEHEHDGECGCGCGEHEHDGECGCGCGEHEHSKCEKK